MVAVVVVVVGATAGVVLGLGLDLIVLFFVHLLFFLLLVLLFFLFFSLLLLLLLLLRYCCSIVSFISMCMSSSPRLGPFYLIACVCVYVL